MDLFTNKVAIQPTANLRDYVYQEDIQLQQRVYSMRVSVIDQRTDMLETLFELKTENWNALTFWPNVRKFLQNKKGFQLTLHATPKDHLHVMMLCKTDRKMEEDPENGAEWCVWRKADTDVFIRETL